MIINNDTTTTTTVIIISIMYSSPLFQPRLLFLLDMADIQVILSYLNTERGTKKCHTIEARQNRSKFKYRNNILMYLFNSGINAQGAQPGMLPPQLIYHYYFKCRVKCKDKKFITIFIIIIMLSTKHSNVHTSRTPSLFSSRKAWQEEHTRSGG